MNKVPELQDCIECRRPADWVRATQFSGDHPFCDMHARLESDFGLDDPSYFYWVKLPARPGRPPRPSFDQLYMQFASMLSQRSTCTRASVGCVVVTLDNTQMLSLGYNGGAKGLANKCDGEVGRCCVHAEMNAISKLDYNIPKGKRIYTTTEPCRLCSILIVNAGISEVVYLKEYRLHEGLEVLGQAGIKVVRFAKDELIIPAE